MANNKKFITIRVHPNFFNDFFEPNRKKLEKKRRAKVGQVEFSQTILDNFKMRKNKKFLPKKFRGLNFYA